MNNFQPNRALPLRRATALLLFGVIIAGCAGATEEQPVVSSQPAAPTEEAPKALGYDPEAVLRFNFSTGPAQGFDPDKVANPVFLTWLLPIYDSLLYMRTDGSVEPMLAEKIEQNDKGLRLELIKGWNFHDGEPFNAEAVRLNIERSQTLEGSKTALALSAVTGIEVLNDYELQLNVDGNVAALQISLAGAAGMMISPAEFDRGDVDINPKGGSGQFELVSFVLDEFTEYSAVPDYWDARVSGTLAGLVIAVTKDDEARLNSVLDGTNQMGFLRPQQVEIARGEGLSVIADKPGMNLYFMGLNNSVAPLDDVLDRRAIEHAIDKSAITEGLLEGLCLPTSQIFPGFFWASDPNIASSAYPYNPDLSRKLLAEAGHQDGFKLSAVANSGKVYVDIATIIQAQLAEVGIDLTIEPRDPDAAREAFEIAKSHAVTFNQVNLSLEPSVSIPQFFEATGARNPGGFEAAGIDRLRTDGLKAFEQGQRAIAYRGIMQLAVDNVYPNVNLCHVVSAYVHDGTVQGLELSADGLRRLRGVSVAAKTN